jgi:hypothetical protein
MWNRERILAPSLLLIVVSILYAIDGGNLSLALVLLSAGIVGIVSSRFFPVAELSHRRRFLVWFVWLAGVGYLIWYTVTQ